MGSKTQYFSMFHSSVLQIEEKREKKENKNFWDIKNFASKIHLKIVQFLQIISYICVRQYILNFQMGK